jgi:RimK family alpha-L-glutamate ligase
LKKILLLSEASATDYSVSRFKQEALLLGVELIHYKYSQIEISFQNNTYSLSVEGKEIVKEFDYFLLRSSKTKYGVEYGYLTGIIKHLAHENGKYVLNYEFSTLHRNFCNKIHNYFVMASFGLPVINSKIYLNLEQLEKDKSNLKYPLIAKNARGSHGKGIHLINKYEDILEYAKTNNLHETLIQDFIDTEEDKRWDIRIMIAGKEILGAFKRTVDKEVITTNIAAGGHGEKFILTEELKSIANKIIDIFKVEYAGIDIMFKDGKPLILEINKSPQFEGFETTTKVNVARKLLEYVLTNNSSI